MRKTISLILLTFLAGFSEVSAQFAKWTNTELTLNNGVVSRIIKLPVVEDSFLTTSYKPVSGEFKFFQKQNEDFQFEVNGIIYSGKGKWTLLGINPLKDERQGDGVAVVLLSEDKKLQLTVKFLLYPNLPVIRKAWW